MGITWHFALTAFAAMAAIGFGLTRLLEGAAERHTLEGVGVDARDAVAGRLVRHLTPEDLTGPLSDDRLESFDTYVRSEIISSRTARVVVWSRTGQVVYSDDRTQLGAVFPETEERARAKAGKTVAELSHGDGGGSDVDHSDSGELLEVYTPIIFPGTPEVEGIFEIYQAYAPVREQLSEMRRQIGV